jgi:hypothetical protein
LQAYFGFVQDIHGDIVDIYANIESREFWHGAPIDSSGTNRIAMTMTGLEPLNPNVETGIAGSVNYAFMYRANDGFSYTAYSPVTFQERRQCAYRSISQDFTCPSFGLGLFAEGFGLKVCGSRDVLGDFPICYRILTFN